MWIVANSNEFICICYKSITLIQLPATCCAKVSRLKSCLLC